MSVPGALVVAATASVVAAVLRTSPLERSNVAAPARQGRWRGVPDRVRATLARRRSDVGGELAAATSALAAHVRAGGSVEEGFAAVGRSSEGKVGAACRGLAERLAFGEALDRWAEEIGTSDAALLATTLRMHRRAGGSLAPVLEELATTARERSEVEADLHALTAQGRMSAWIVGSLPLGFLAFLTLLTGSSIVGTFATPLGALLLVVGLSLEAAAVVWMRRILEVRA